MARPKKTRQCRELSGERLFKPRGIPARDLEVIRLELSELEAMRLCDLDGLDQAAAGERMGVSRGTVQRMLRSGREKLLQALVVPATLMIEKGNDDETLHTDGG